MFIRAFIVLWLILTLQGAGILRIHVLAVANAVSDDVMPDEFFSGSVQEFSDTSVTVSRSLPGKSPEPRVFVLDVETKVEGKLKKLARVTVGYRNHEGQEVAWRIIVRESPE